MKGDQGQVLGFAQVMRDLTQQRSTEEQLQHSQDLTALLISSTEDYAIFTLDPLGYVRTWNLGAQKLKGFDAPEIIGTHFSRFLHRRRQDKQQANQNRKKMRISFASVRSATGCWSVESKAMPFSLLTPMERSFRGTQAPRQSSSIKAKKLSAVIFRNFTPRRMLPPKNQRGTLKLQPRRVGLKTKAGA